MRSPSFAGMAFHVIAATLLFAQGHALGGISYPMVLVTNAGNSNDSTGYGAVAYEYAIGKFDVTIGNYTTFLNAVDANGTNTYGLYNTSMGTDLNVAGIAFNAGAAAGSKYSVIGSANRPITYVSWFDAARFANWMSNGQGNGGTETGSYTMNGNNVVPKNAGAIYAIPTENEWYKAAFYSPFKGGPSSPGYYAFATQSDAAPGNHVGNSPNQANWKPGDVFSVTQSSSYSASQNYLTDVGAFSGSASYYGTFDQSGLVYEWMGQGAARGGFWGNNNSLTISSGARAEPPQSSEAYYLGFRLAAVPEPSTWAMLLTGLAAGGWRMIRRRR